MLLLYHRVEVDDLEDVIELQERPDEVGFIPSTSFLKPYLWVFKGPQDVVEMNQDAFA